MADGANGYRAAMVSRQLTPGLISSLPETAGLLQFISFSTSYPELDLVYRARPQDHGGPSANEDYYRGGLQSRHDCRESFRCTVRLPDDDRPKERPAASNRNLVRRA